MGPPYIYIYTPPQGLGLEKNKKIDGVYYLLVHMQTDQICSKRHKARPMGAHRAPVVVVCFAADLTSLHIHTRNCYTLALVLFFLAPNPVVGYIYGVPTLVKLCCKQLLEPRPLKNMEFVNPDG